MEQEKKLIRLGVQTSMLSLYVLDSFKGECLNKQVKLRLTTTSRGKAAPSKTGLLICLNWLICRNYWNRWAGWSILVLWINIFDFFPKRTDSLSSYTVLFKFQGSELHIILPSKTHAFPTLLSESERPAHGGGALRMLRKKYSKQHSKIYFRNSYAYESSHGPMSTNTEQSTVIHALLKDQDRKV